MGFAFQCNFRFQPVLTASGINLFLLEFEFVYEMKAIRGWRLGRTSHMPGARHRARTEKPVWIIAVVSLIIMFVIGAYMFPHHSKAACYMLSSKGCKGFTDWLPTSPREFPYDEITARVVTREVLSSPRVIKKTSKIAFMFLTPGILPFEKLWDLFFRVNYISSNPRILC